MSAGLRQRQLLGRNAVRGTPGNLRSQTRATAAVQAGLCRPDLGGGVREGRHHLQLGPKHGGRSPVCEHLHRRRPHRAVDRLRCAGQGDVLGATARARRPIRGRRAVQPVVGAVLLHTVLDGELQRSPAGWCTATASLLLLLLLLLLLFYYFIWGGLGALAFSQSCPAPPCQYAVRIGC